MIKKKSSITRSLSSKRSMNKNNKLRVLVLIISVAIIVPALLMGKNISQSKLFSFAADTCDIQVSAGSSIQSALDIIQPGQTICLSPGIYHERLFTKRAGTATAPITIRGTDIAKDPNLRFKTILYGTSSIININHSYYHLEGFAVDGQEMMKDLTFPTDPTQVPAFKSNNKSLAIKGKIIYIANDTAARDITGVVIHNMYLRRAGEECLRMRNNSNGNEISDSVIEWCGLFPKPSDGFDYHNGEGVYIGTSLTSTDQPMYANDQSRYNIVKNNIIHTYGSECFEVKENAHHNTLLQNECAYNLEPGNLNGSNIELRGQQNTIENNSIFSSAGVNIKLKSDSAAYNYGGNSIIRNTLTNATGDSVSNSQDNKGVLCGNSIEGTVSGLNKAELTSSCVDNTATPSPTIIPSATPTMMPSPTLTPTRTPTPTDKPTPTSTPLPTSLILKATITPIADAYTNASSKSSNYGTKSSIAVVSGSSIKTGYLKFNLLSFKDKTIKSAKLKMYVSDSSSNTISIKSVTDITWGEKTITYSNRPTTGTSIATLIPSKSSSFIEVDLTNYFMDKAGQTVSLGFDSNSTNTYEFASRDNSTSARRPVLTLEYN
ncbi:hypothetical protein BH09PAT2_BH09PAT2_02530 [soil metagenome]